MNKDKNYAQVNGIQMKKIHAKINNTLKKLKYENKITNELQKNLTVSNSSIG